ncbi:unnamed protein product, partial [Didymodactylos carnosus]
KMITENDNVEENETRENQPLIAPPLSVHKPQPTSDNTETTDTEASEEESTATMKTEPTAVESTSITTEKIELPSTQTEVATGDRHHEEDTIAKPQADVAK